MRFSGWTRGRHQASAHIIVPDDGQHAAMQDDDLLAQHSPDGEHRLNQYRQIGKILDKFKKLGGRIAELHQGIVASVRKISSFV